MWRSRRIESGRSSSEKDPVTQHINIFPILLSAYQALTGLRGLSNLCAYTVGAVHSSFTVFKTAREKQRSVTAEEAAAALADAEKVIKSNTSGNTPPLRNTMSVPNSRANKPLGWFLADDIVEKMGAVKVEGAKASDEKKKRRTRRGSKNKASDQMSNPTLSEGSVASDDMFEDKQRADMPRDDYWYYDVASDGYYYEQNGAKGWRRRMPNSALQKIKEQETAQVAGKPTAPATAQNNVQQIQAQAAAQAQAALLQSQLFHPSNMNNRYYDPSSDGFFYEMASVDGWKRRQPTSLSTSSSGSSKGALASSPISSYGAALARGQLPRTSIIDDSSASSSISEDTISTDPFGADAGFSFPETIPVSRPDHLHLSDAQLLSGFDAQTFINDLTFSGVVLSKQYMSMGLKTCTPADTWTSRCKNWNISGEVVVSPDEDAMGHLYKGLENIWAAPTPVKNQ